MAKRRKTTLAIDVPKIKFRKGLFILEYDGVQTAYPPELFIACHAAAGRAIREWQETNAKSVVLLRKRGGGH